MTTEARDALVAEVSAAIVGTARYTRAQVCAAADVPPERATRLWRAMGFAEPADDAALFTDEDVAALRSAESLRTTGVVDEDGLVALARSMAQALSRLAVAHAAIAGGYLLGSAGGDTSVTHQVDRLVPDVGGLLGYVWRRHLVAAAESAVVTALGDGATDAPVAVGFADLVGFTELSRELTTAELGDLVERFESVAATVVADHGGRVVKTLGDEVMFTSSDVRAAVELALALAAATEVLGRAVRVGVAYGPVLAHLGDVFGETVNIASRLTGIAHPGTVLVDREAAHALRDDETYDVAAIGRRSVRGYAHLAPFRVRRVSPT